MSIADAILTQIQQAGQPRSIKSTETVTGKEPIDIGGLGMLLFMLMQGMGKEGGAPLGGPEAGGIFPGAGLQGMENLMPSFGAPPQAQGFGGMDPMQLIMSFFGGGAGLSGAPGLPRVPGLGGFG